MNRARLYSDWGLVLGWMAVIFTLSGIPSLTTGLGVWDLILRKLAHVTEFAVLTALLLRAVIQTWPGWTARGVGMASGFIALFYAFTDEFHQLFVPGRVGSLWDIGIDSLGIILVLLIWRPRFSHPHIK